MHAEKYGEPASSVKVQWGRSIDRSAHDRAKHDGDDHVRGRRLAQEACARDPNEDDRQCVDDDGAKRDLDSAQVRCIDSTSQEGGDQW